MSMPANRWILAGLLALLVICSASALETSADAVGAPASLPATGDPIEIIRRVAENEEQNEKRERDYTYVQYVTEKKLGRDGEVKSTETRTYEVLNIYGESVEKQVAKDDQPLSPKQAANEEQKIEDLIAKYKNESETQRKKRLEKAEKEREESRAFVKEIAEAYDLTLLPPDNVDGRPMLVISGEPKPGYKPHTSSGRYLTKIRGKIWIDPAEYQWTRMDLETIDTISWGWFLARLHKGTHIFVEQKRINEEVWLPSFMHVTLGARLALLKDLRYDVTQTYRDYKKFRAESKITGFSEVPQ